MAGLIMFGFFVEHALHPAATLISTFLGTQNPLELPGIFLLTAELYSWIWLVVDVC